MTAEELDHGSSPAEELVLEPGVMIEMYDRYVQLKQTWDRTSSEGRLTCSEEASQC